MKKVETIYRTCHCGSPLCPNCEKRKADKNFKTTLNDFKAIKEIIGNYMIIFFVLTVPNCSIYDLDSEKREILKSAKFFIKSYGDRVVYANRRFEFTPGKEKDKDGKLLKMRANQHVNVTMVYSLDDMRFDNMSMFNHTEVLKRWRVACGNDPSIKDVFFEVIPEEDLHEVIKYTVKSSDILGKGVDYYAAVLDFAVKTKGERSFLRSGSMIKKINAVKKNNKESDKEAETKILVPFTSFEWNEKKVDYTEIYKEWWSLVRLGSVCDTQRYRLDPDFGSKFYEQEAILDSA
jgi:hypothetical protein